jgi:tRNA A37 methylthiotransferase MiaB
MTNTSNKKLYMISLGCSKNLVDSEVMLGGLRMLICCW